MFDFFSSPNLAIILDIEHFYNLRPFCVIFFAGRVLFNHHNPFANGPALKSRVINHMISSTNQSKLRLKELAIVLHGKIFAVK